MMGVAALFIVLVVLAVLVIGGLLAAGRAQGSESTLMQAGFVEPDADDVVEVERELTAEVQAKVEGHGEGAPEPAGPPPVAGAQWDEIHARWIVWDQATGGWVPVAGEAPPAAGAP